MRRALLACVLLGAATAAQAAYCPCYTAASPANTYHCAIDAAAGTNPTPAQWQNIFALVAQGPSAWGAAGPSVADIGQGCGKPEVSHKVPARFPCEVLKAIAMQESSWKQFCVPTTPADQVGGASRTIISFDCGYGIGQVTSGMHVNETPSFDRLRVASDATYNLATGTQILASKWSYTQCVGDNQPSIVEHWYTSAWAYNGLAYSNNPSNPIYNSNRGVWNPSVGGSAPYQEKVFGWAEYPPSGWWVPVPLAYPNPAQVGGSGAPPALPDPSCSTPTNCVATRPTHISNCFSGPVDAGTPDAGAPDAGLDGGAASPDAGADGGEGDAGTTTEAPPASGEGLGPVVGCSCGSSGVLGAAWVLFALAALGALTGTSARRRGRF
jgi:hypothetical protein